MLRFSGKIRRLSEGTTKVFIGTRGHAGRLLASRRRQTCGPVLSTSQPLFVHVEIDTQGDSGGCIGGSAELDGAQGVCGDAREVGGRKGSRGRKVDTGGRRSDVGERDSVEETHLMAKIGVTDAEVCQGVAERWGGGRGILQTTVPVHGDYTRFNRRPGFILRAGILASEVEPSCGLVLVVRVKLEALLRRGGR